MMGYPHFRNGIPTVILSLLANSVPRGYTRKKFPSISDVCLGWVLEKVGVNVGATGKWRPGRGQMREFDFDNGNYFQNAPR